MGALEAPADRSDLSRRSRSISEKALRLLRIVPDNTKFDFMRFRRVSFPISAALSMILLVGAAYAIVYVSDRKRSAYGWFVLASFSGAAYAAWTLGLMQPLCGAFDPVVVGFMILLR